MKRQISRLVILVLAGFLCFVHAGRSAGQTRAMPESETEFMPDSIPNSILTIENETVAVRQEANPLRNVYFGDLHVHTAYSFDAFVFGTVATPYDAYRYAKGEAIRHPAGFDVQLRAPLDFYAVTDHAEFLGVVPAVADTSTEISKIEIYEPFHDLNANLNPWFMSLPRSIQALFIGPDLGKRFDAFTGFMAKTVMGIQDGTIDKQMLADITRSAWLDIIQAAEEHNEPGRFTTFLAYEYTSSSDDMGNLHRNVIFKGDNRAPAIPFSRFHSQNPEGLWDWMDELREQGIESLAIPHNSNGSNGQMFKRTDWAGNAMNASYAEQRMRNEPLVELSQIKGASETHPALSPNDEWADFEIMPYRVGTDLLSEPRGSYARSALQLGLEMEVKDGTNPYKFGFVGASDTHTCATSDDEADFFGKVGLMDADPVLRGSVPMPTVQAWITRKVAGDDLVVDLDGREYTTFATRTFGSAGLTGVWAEENTRDSIYSAFRRKETFTTSGPRIRVRFFAGFDLEDNVINSKDMVARAYEGGVTMGSDLPSRDGVAPMFLVWATRDPMSAALQRVQIIKGWVEHGQQREKVYDVACSDGLEVDPTTHRCPDNGAEVNLSDCSITPDVGDAQMKALWTDPDFDPTRRAFYYVRVLENPTCRWSTWDAVRDGVEPRPDLKKTLQERAWSSPIWYVP
jgi:hypothetical protein